MVAGSIEERIKKMKQAILTEAKQRANQIVDDANEEANQERAKIYNAEKEKIDVEFAILTKNQAVKAKIEKSAVINKHRIAKMHVRYEKVEELREEVQVRLKAMCSEAEKYKSFIKQLIVQGMLRMMERNVSVETKKEHTSMIESLFSICEKEFSQILLRETGQELASKLNISEYNLEEKHHNILGGIFLRSSDGLIVCDNSIDSRVKLVFEQLLPSIRALLFTKTNHNAKEFR